MKNFKYITALFIGSIIFLSCGTSNINFSNAEDDVFWSSKNTTLNNNARVSNNANEISQRTYNEINQPRGNFTPIESYQENLVREENAYNEWNRKRNFETNQLPQNEIDIEEQAQERENRRIGSERTFYYNDPYFNSLSNNWGWTSFYTPIFRPGFYNWAPGWNIGLGWNSFSGWNVGIGYNAFFPGWGWNNWGWNRWGMYDPWCTWCNPWYNPWNPWGFYDPFWWPGWGFNYWYWNRFNNPWFWHNNRFNNFNGNDIVMNRPMFKPRSGGANQGGGSSLPPRGRIANDMNNQAQPTNQNPATQRLRPEIPQQQLNTTRPGGDIVRDREGNPTYIPPRSRPDNNQINNPQIQPDNIIQQPGMRNDRVQPSTPGNRDYSPPPVRDRGNQIDRYQPQQPPIQREAPSQPRSNPRSFDGSGGFGTGGFSSPGIRGGGGGGTAPVSRPR